MLKINKTSFIAGAHLRSGAVESATFVSTSLLYSEIDDIDGEERYLSDLTFLQKCKIMFFNCFEGLILAIMLSNAISAMNLSSIGYIALSLYIVKTMADNDSAI